ncbi:MAG: hypothetical protein ABFR90_07870 [Planctomycetota bacterium]
MNIKMTNLLFIVSTMFFLLLSNSAYALGEISEFEKGNRKKEHNAPITVLLSILETLSSKCDTVNIYLKETGSVAVDIHGPKADSQAESFQRRTLEAIRDCSLDIQYQLLELAYLNGLFDMVSKSGEIEPVNDRKPYDDIKCALIRARASAAQYEKLASTIQRRWPTTKEAVQLRNLAKRCTNNYEHAYRKSETKFDKIRIASQWLNLLAQRYYDADSQLLRKGTMLNIKPSECEYSQIESQIDLFRKTLRKSLDEIHMSQDKIDVMVEPLALLFAKVAVIGIPENVFEDTLRDLPAFCKYTMPFVSGSNKKMFTSFQWYLWSAIITPLPDAIEREVIDSQVDELSKLIENQLDAVITQHPRLKPAGEKHTELFRNSYKSNKDNRFVPYYKKAMLPCQFKLAMEKIKNEWDERKRSLGSVASNYNHEKDTSPEETYIELRRSYITALLLTFYHEICYQGSPSYNHLPKKIVLGYRSGLRGDLEGDLFFVHSISEYKSFPQYPWKKRMTTGGWDD